MKQYISYFLFALVIIGFSFGATEKAFSQANQKENRIGTAGSTKPDGTAPYVKGITTQRAKSLVGAVSGLISLVIGWRAKLRSKRDAGSGRSGAFTALAFGLVCIILSMIHLSTSYNAALGNGSGKAGAVVALLLGFTGMTLAGLALRSKTNKMER